MIYEFNNDKLLCLMWSRIAHVPSKDMIAEFVATAEKGGLTLKNYSFDLSRTTTGILLVEFKDLESLTMAKIVLV